MVVEKHVPSFCWRLLTFSIELVSAYLQLLGIIFLYQTSQPHQPSHHQDLRGSYSCTKLHRDVGLTDTLFFFWKVLGSLISMDIYFVAVGVPVFFVDSKLQSFSLFLPWKEIIFLLLPVRRTRVFWEPTSSTLFAVCCLPQINHSFDLRVGPAALNILVTT